MSILFALSNEEYVCRKVCNPIRCVIPVLAAAGRMIVRMRHCPQYGLFPRAAGLVNTQSSTPLTQPPNPCKLRTDQRDLSPAEAKAKAPILAACENLEFL
jgi:hypothetical protein